MKRTAKEYHTKFITEGKSLEDIEEFFNKEIKDFEIEWKKMYGNLKDIKENVNYQQLLQYRAEYRSLKL